MEDLQKLTPELIHAAKEIAVQADIEEEDEDEEMNEKTRQYEHLNLLSHEWATKVCVCACVCMCVCMSVCGYFIMKQTHCAM